MFTGIIEATAAVLRNTDAGMVIERPEMFDDLGVGSSVCVSGVCLTVVELGDERIRFDVTEETSERTMLGSLQGGDRVNLERALKAGGRLEGHIVQGHVDGVGRVERIERSTRSTRSTKSTKSTKKTMGTMLTIGYPKALRGLIVGKGSIALDGVSLTVVEVNGDALSVALIPQTLAVTTLGSLGEGDAVNLEADVVGKYVKAQGAAARRPYTNLRGGYKDLQEFARAMAQWLKEYDSGGAT